jgi:hypothetical protein
MTKPITRRIPIPTPREVAQMGRPNRAERRRLSRQTRGHVFTASFTSLDDLCDFLEIVRAESSATACE